MKSRNLKTSDTQKEKLFKCHMCQKNFSRKDGLSKHLEGVHEKQKKNYHFHLSCYEKHFRDTFEIEDSQWTDEENIRQMCMPVLCTY